MRRTSIRGAAAVLVMLAAGTSVLQDLGFAQHIEPEGRRRPEGLSHLRNIGQLLRCQQRDAHPARDGLP